MNTALQGRVAVVTGASAGIGKAAAEHLAMGGAGVVLNARRADTISKLAGEINQRTGRTCAVTVPGDAAEPAPLEALEAQEALRELRDLRDRIDGAPLFEELVGGLERGSSDSDFPDRVRFVGKLFDHHERFRNSASRAELMHACGLRHAWTRESLAEVYGTTPGQMRVQTDMVRPIVQGLRPA